MGSLVKVLHYTSMGRLARDKHSGSTLTQLSHKNLDQILIFAAMKYYVHESRKSPLKALTLPSTFIKMTWSPHPRISA